MAKKQRDTHTTKEVGAAQWAHIVTPDVYKPEKGEAKKRYKIEVRFPGFGAYQKKLKAAIDKRIAAELARSKAEAKSAAAKKKLKVTEDLPYGFVLDAEGNETEEWYIRAHMNAEYVDRSGNTKTMAPRIFDAKGNPITDRSLQVGNGSLVKINFEFYPYTMKTDVGCALRLNAVQIITLVEYGGAAASEYGFGEEDGDDLSDRSFGDGSDSLSADADEDEDEDAPADAAEEEEEESEDDAQDEDDF